MPELISLRDYFAEQGIGLSSVVSRPGTSSASAVPPSVARPSATTPVSGPDDEAIAARAAVSLLPRTIPVIANPSAGGAAALGGAALGVGLAAAGQQDAAKAVGLVTPFVSGAAQGAVSAANAGTSIASGAASGLAASAAALPFAAFMGGGPFKLVLPDGEPSERLIKRAHRTRDAVLLERETLRGLQSGNLRAPVRDSTVGDTLLAILNNNLNGTWRTDTAHGWLPDPALAPLRDKLVAMGFTGKEPTLGDVEGVGEMVMGGSVVAPWATPPEPTMRPGGGGEDTIVESSPDFRVGPQGWSALLRRVAGVPDSAPNVWDFGRPVTYRNDPMSSEGAVIANPSPSLDYQRFVTSGGPSAAEQTNAENTFVQYLKSLPPDVGRNVATFENGSYANATTPRAIPGGDDSPNPNSAPPGPVSSEQAESQGSPTGAPGAPGTPGSGVGPGGGVGASPDGGLGDGSNGTGGDGGGGDGGSCYLASYAMDAFGLGQDTRQRQFFARLAKLFLARYPETGMRQLVLYQRVAKGILAEIEDAPANVQAGVQKLIYDEVIAPTGARLDASEVEATKRRLVTVTLALATKFGVPLPVNALEQLTRRPKATIARAA